MTRTATHLAVFFVMLVFPVAVAAPVAAQTEEPIVPPPVPTLPPADVALPAPTVSLPAPTTTLGPVEPVVVPPPAAPAIGAAEAAVLAQQQQIAELQRLMYGVIASRGPATLPDGGPTFDPNAYMANGASMLTVPSGNQPGAAWYTNGAEVLTVPAAPSATASPVVPSTLADGGTDSAAGEDAQAPFDAAPDANLAADATDEAVPTAAASAPSAQKNEAGELDAGAAEPIALAGAEPAEAATTASPPPPPRENSPTEPASAAPSGTRPVLTVALGAIALAVGLFIGLVGRRRAGA